MAYESSKEKVFKAEETVLSNKVTKAVGKVYSYNGGSKKFKILFYVKDKTNEFWTSKFPAISNEEDLTKIKNLINKFPKTSFNPGE